MGNYGYLVTYPSDYSARASWGEKEKTQEIVEFFPGTRPPESSEAPGLVRLEAQPVNDATGKPIGLDVWLNHGMAPTMERNGETFTVVGATATIPGIKISISNPKTTAKLYQIVLRGKYVLYMFSSYDEALVESLAHGLAEVQPTDRPGQ
jgi:hypothetical protein